MRALVTGAAGFIGSGLVEQLLAQGDDVIGIDAFTDYYDASTKRSNVSDAVTHRAFSLEEIDLSEDDLSEHLDGVEVVFHLAGQPGVRASWGRGFADYVRWNVAATQRVLEACRGRPLRRFVNSSSSSIYGRAERLPTSESDVPQPISPYGVTKLAAEHLCTLYGTEFGVPTVSLRYFTVYGPRQRPDMAIRRLINAAIDQHPFILNGDGSQVRDFTFVDDVISANLLAAESDVDPGAVFNIGGGSATSLAEVIELVERATGVHVPLEHAPRADGDPPATGADTSRARELLGWTPAITIREGIKEQVEWQRGD